MIALTGGFDPHAVEAVFGDQVLGEFAARARKVRPLRAVTVHDVLHPELRAEDGREQQRDQDKAEDVHVGSPKTGQAQAPCAQYCTNPA